MFLIQKIVVNSNRGEDTLDGGSGADTMLGRAGNDTYVVDNIGDVVREYANSGRLKGLAGTDTLQGGIGDDVLEGGTGNNDLFEGGAGFARMARNGALNCS